MKSLLLSVTFAALLTGGAADAFAAGPSSAGVVVPLEDGSLVVAGGSAVCHRYSTLEKLLPAFLGLGYGYGGDTFDSAGLGLASVTATGEPNERFGKKGYVVTALPPHRNHDGAEATALVRDKRGRLIVVGWRSATTWLDSGLTYLTAARYDPSGAIDTTFGEHGIVTIRMNSDAYTGASAAIVDDQGRLVVVGYNGGRRLHGGVKSYDDWTNHLYLARLTEDGRLDSSFGQKGFAVVDVIAEHPTDAYDARCKQDPQSCHGLHHGTEREYLCYTRPPAALATDTQGRLIAGGSASDGTLILVRFLPDGSLDPKFANGGTSRTPMSTGSSVAQIVRDREGRLLVVATAGDRIALLRYTADGAVDRTFGTGGVRETPFAKELTPSAATLSADGTFFVAAYSRHALAIGLFGADGLPVKAFGHEGIMSSDFSLLTGPAGLMLNASGDPTAAACSDDGVAVVYAKRGSRVP